VAPRVGPTGEVSPLHPMKTSVRIGMTILATSLLWLFGGCASQTASAYRNEPLNDFEVVETSSKRHLTAREMAYLRAKVADYLQQQGETGSGDYYIKLYLGEEAGVNKGEWVIVRFTRYPSAVTGRLASYDPVGYPGYPPYQYDYLPFAWMGFGALSFRYYDDPYYYGYARSTPRWYHPRHTGGWRDRDGKHDSRHWHHGNRRPDGRPRDKEADKDRWTHHPGSGHRPTAGFDSSVTPAPSNRPRWENRHDRAPEGNRTGPRRDFQRSETGRRPGVPPRTVPSAYNRPESTDLPARVGGQRERGPSHVAPQTGPRPRVDAPQPVPSGRQRDYTPPARREPNNDARSTDSSRTERPDNQFNTGESRREAPPVNRPVLQDGGRRARER